MNRLASVSVGLPLSSLTQKDKVDIQKALDMGVDWIALSFVQTEKDVEALKKIVGNKSLIMAKIEKPSALKNLDSILSVSDGIMIARGDLGVELAPEKIPSKSEWCSPVSLHHCRHSSAIEISISSRFSGNFASTPSRST